jgi:hypothetical protein
MSLPPVISDLRVPLGEKRRKRALGGMFDLIHAKQLLLTPPAENADGASRVAGRRDDVLSRAALVPTPQIDPASTHAQETLDQARHARHDGEKPTTAHGTLPVLVMGQLVELTLLREARSSRHDEPVRRMRMRLDAEAGGRVTIDARVQDGRLVIDFGSTAPADAELRARVTAEICALAARLGWQFDPTPETLT